MAVLASVVSGVVILAMSLSFLVCCLQERSGRDRAKKEGRSRWECQEMLKCIFS